MGPRALRIAAIAVAGALALAGCRNDRNRGYGGSGRVDQRSSQPAPSYGRSAGDQSGVTDQDLNRGTGGSGTSSTSGQSGSSGTSDQSSSGTSTGSSSQPRPPVER